MQQKVKADRCNYCHDKKDRKVVVGYGKPFHAGLGQGDASKYKYEKSIWKQVNGKYSEKAIQLIRDAIKRAAEES